MNKVFRAAVITKLNEIRESRATTSEKRGTLSRAREKMKEEPNGNLQLEKKKHTLILNEIIQWMGLESRGGRKSSVNLKTDQEKLPKLKKEEKNDWKKINKIEKIYITYV